MLINLLRGTGLDGLDRDGPGAAAPAPRPAPLRDPRAVRAPRADPRRGPDERRSPVRAQPRPPRAAPADGRRSPGATSSRCSCARPRSSPTTWRSPRPTPTTSIRPTPRPSPRPPRPGPGAPCAAGWPSRRVPAGRGDGRRGCSRVATRRASGLRDRRRPPGRTSRPAATHRGRRATSVARRDDQHSQHAASRVETDGHPTPRPVGAGHHAAQLHVDPQGQAGDLRATGRLRREPPPCPPPGGDHLDPRERVRLRDLDHPGAAQPAQLRRARRHLRGTARSTARSSSRGSRRSTGSCTSC